MKSESQALAALTSLCARGEHCTQEMLDKMTRWELSEEAQARVIDYLTSHHYVDDERYTRAFVNDKIRYNKWGRRKIEQALWTKRIPKETIDSVLNSIDDHEYLDVLRPLLDSKRRSIKARSAYEETMKLTKFALSRGFTYDIIRQCINGADDIE